jgi:hypothetical protein
LPAATAREDSVADGLGRFRKTARTTRNPPASSHERLFPCENLNSTMP